ncbi:hypothetical protein F5X96DRAFT_495791 [Biscogniauxia mediterranea]|nr:hypothetical protein F5X96DRAFT_495791 [Biscogniauxia mediterranea]
MAGTSEPSALSKRKLTTYGKSARKKQPKPAFAPIATSESMSDEDPLSTANTTITRLPSAHVSSPSNSSPIMSKSRSQGQGRAGDSSHKIPSSGQKRKFSQIYPSKGRAQDDTPSDEESSHSVPEPRRSRTSAPDHARALPKSGSNARARVRSGSSESIDDLADAQTRLSSPPLTPTNRKSSKPGAKVTFQSAKPVAADASIEKEVRQVNSRQHKIPMHLARDFTQKPKQPRATSSATDEKRQPVPKARASIPNPHKKPRKRLIDTLAEQTSDDVAEADDTPDTQTRSSQPISSQTSDTSMLDSQTVPSTPNAKPRTAQSTSTARTFARSSSVLKFTYGQGRKVLEEEDSLLDSLALPEESSVPLKGRRLELRGPKTLSTPGGPFDDDDPTAGGSPNAKLRDIHELRQAGANSRVADAMQDLIDQMGIPSTKPSSSRRSALLQVAEKIKDKTFMRQCRDHGVEATMLKDVAKETDTISGFLILSILTTIVAKWPSAHITRLLVLEESGHLFARLLGVHDDIKKIARDRKSNLSKRSQNSIVAIQNTLRELSIWDGADPTQLSPRSLAIKCLHLLTTQKTGVADAAIFSLAVTEQLFEVLSDATQTSEYWDYPNTVESIDLFGSLSVLDFYAVGIADVQSENNEWAAKYLPVVAGIFGMSLQIPARENKRLESSVLKLVINLTNNSLGAPEIFASKGVLPALAGSISDNFTQVLTSISQDAWTDGILDGLVLRIGILINFAEHSSLVRQIVNDCHHEGKQPVNDFIRLFLENHRRTSEADSMEKSHLNVAFGYLSVLLGYLSLHAPVRQKLKANHSARSIGPLIDSIREFIAHYEKVESAMDESESSAKAHSSYTERLQALVHQLEGEAIYD